MTGSDYAVLAFLAGALLYAPANRHSAMLLLGVTATTALVALLAGNTELALVACTVLAAFALALLSTLKLWKSHALAMLKTKLGAHHFLVRV